MKIQYSLFILLILLSACGPSPEAIATMTVASWTATHPPTATNTPTATPTATPVPSPTVIPTPLGGGTGKLLFVASQNVYSINSDGTGLQQIIDRQGLSSLTGQEVINEIRLLDISPDGQMLLVWICINDACWDQYHARGYVYVVDINMKTAINLGRVGGKQDTDGKFSPDGNKILYMGEGGFVYVADIDGSNEKKISRVGEMPSIPRGRSLQWSFDSKSVYFPDGFSEGSGYFIANADGSNRRMFFPTPFYNRVREVKANVYSPDGSKIALAVNEHPIGWLYIIDSEKQAVSKDDLLMEFKDEQGGIVEIKWFPDNIRLLAELFNCGGFCTDGDIVIIDSMQGVIKKTFSASKYGWLCDITPDRKQFISIFGRSKILLSSLDDETSLQIIIPFDVTSCPLQLP